MDDDQHRLPDPPEARHRTMSHLVLKLNHAGFGSLVLDGEAVARCRSVSIDATVGQPTTATLTLIGVNVEADVLADVTTVEDTVRICRFGEQPDETTP